MQHVWRCSVSKYLLNSPIQCVCLLYSCFLHGKLFVWYPTVTKTITSASNKILNSTACNKMQSRSSYGIFWAVFVDCYSIKVRECHVDIVKYKTSDIIKVFNLTDNCQPILLLLLCAFFTMQSFLSACEVPLLFFVDCMLIFCLHV